MRRGKVCELIEASIAHHEMNTHSFGEPIAGCYDRATTNYSIHDVLDLILDHLNLEVVEVVTPRSVKLVKKKEEEV